MKKNNDSKNTVLLVICVIVLFLLVVGVSYAAVFYSKIGDKINTVTTGSITMSYSEKTNGINITNAQPTDDEVGKVLNQANEYFDFTVSATLTGNIIINYSITATKDTGSSLPDEAIKVYLTELNNLNEQEVLLPTKISKLSLTSKDISGAPDGEYLLYNGNFSSSLSHNYRLRMWVANDYVVSEEIQTYKLRVNVYGAVAN